MVDADSRGRAPLANETPAHLVTMGKNAAAPYTVSSEQWRQLERNGFLVLDNFLSKQQVLDARERIQRLDAAGKFNASPNERDHNVHDEGSVVRTDRVYMCRESDGALCEIHQQLALFAKVVADSDFGGFHCDSTTQQYQSNNLNVPQQMQVSIYDGSESESSLQRQDFYTSHLDSSGHDSIFETGLLGWLRSHYLRKRYLTCICYLNSNWREGNGGCLRLHKNGAESGAFESEEYIDVPPVAGRLVIFSSLHQWHAVLPTSSSRYACSLWLTLTE